MMRLVEARLTRTEWLVLGSLLGGVGPDGVARMMQRLVAADLGMRRSPVSRAVRSLLARGFVHRAGLGAYVPLPRDLVVRRRAAVRTGTAVIPRVVRGDVLPGATGRAVEDRRSWAAGYRQDAADYRRIGEGDAAMTALAEQLEEMAAAMDAEADRMVAAALERAARKRGST